MPDIEFHAVRRASTPMQTDFLSPSTKSAGITFATSYHIARKELEKILLTVKERMFHCSKEKRISTVDAILMENGPYVSWVQKPKITSAIAWKWRTFYALFFIRFEINEKIIIAAFNNINKLKIHKRFYDKYLILIEKRSLPASTHPLQFS